MPLVTFTAPVNATRRVWIVAPDSVDAASSTLGRKDPTRVPTAPDASV